MVKIKNYPARNGDAFLIADSSSNFNMLVDGGYAETFDQHIAADLKCIQAQGGELGLVIATHIDADHITGLIKFFDKNGNSQSPAIIPVNEVFHNSFRCLVTRSNLKHEVTEDDISLIEEIRTRGYPPPAPNTVSEQEISARQGNSLAKLLQDGGYKWNTSDGTLAIGGNGLTHIQFPTAKIEILGPTTLQLERLKKWWIREIRRLGITGTLENLDDVFEYMCADEQSMLTEQLLSAADGDLKQLHVPDTSVTNGSSISFILEIEGQRLLFLGDSWANEIVTALKSRGRMMYDAVKISHHGSVRNTNQELLQLIDSPHFFISTNGDQHNHPNFAVLKAIVQRPASFKRTLHFNYSTPASRKLLKFENKLGADFQLIENQTDWVQI